MIFIIANSMWLSGKITLKPLQGGFETFLFLWEQII